jgi:hypothetical protein
LKRLLCFREGVWGKLRGAVEKEGWGGEVRRPAALYRSQDERIDRNEEYPPEDHRCLEIDPPEPTWWELAHWGEIYDERRTWGDLSHEARRELRKLLGKG